jgi:hypothetical protein
MLSCPHPTLKEAAGLEDANDGRGSGGDVSVLFSHYTAGKKAFSDLENTFRDTPYRIPGSPVGYME